MNVPIWLGVVDEAGKLRLEDAPRFKAYTAGLSNREVEIVLRPRTRQRSLDQNAWVWGVAYPLIAEAIGYDKHEIEELHYALVAKCFGDHFDRRLGAMVPNKRSSKLTTKEFSEFMEWLVRFAAIECGGVVIPLPGERDTAA